MTPIKDDITTMNIETIGDIEALPGMINRKLAEAEVADAKRYLSLARLIENAEPLTVTWSGSFLELTITKDHVMLAKNHRLESEGGVRIGSLVRADFYKPFRFIKTDVFPIDELTESRCNLIAELFNEMILERGGLRKGQQLCKKCEEKQAKK